MELCNRFSKESRTSTCAASRPAIFRIYLKITAIVIDDYTEVEDLKKAVAQVLALGRCCTYDDTGTYGNAVIEAWINHFKEGDEELGEVDGIIQLFLCTNTK